MTADLFNLSHVRCDRVYEADDYIRDYAEFLSFRESVHA
jgi:hypothetical protein